MNYTAIISSIGREKYLIALIQSILRQTLECSQIIILLDRGVEGEGCQKAIFKNFKTDKIEAVLCSNKNLPEKRNYGAKLAKNEVIIFSDDDDIWNEQKGQTVIDSIQIGYKAICHNFSCFGEKESINCNSLGRRSRALRKLNLLKGDNVYGGGSSIACIRDLVIAIPFDESLLSCEDFDWWIRIQLSGTLIYYVGDDLVSYRRHKTNMGSQKFRMASTLMLVGIKNLKLGILIVVSSISIILKSIIRFIR